MLVSAFYIRLWGALDVAYILWRAYSDIVKSRIPFYDTFYDAYESAVGFGQPSILIFTSIAVILSLLIFLSGPLMLALKRSGVYISLIQFPFRLILVIPPTFFFLSGTLTILPSFAVIALIFLIEIFKAVTQVLWLRSRLE